MPYPRSKRFLSSLLAVTFLLPPTAHAQTPADAAPADSLAFLSFKGAHHLGPAYESSHLKAVLDASTFPRFYRELIPQLLEKALAKDPEDAKHLADALTALEIIGRQGFSVAILPAPDGSDTPISLTLTCDARDEADKLQPLLKPLTEAGPDAKVTVARTGTRLTLHLGAPTPGAAATTLAASPAYQSATKHVDADPVVQLYLDAEQILSRINRFTATDADNPWSKIQPLTGLAGLKRYVITGNFAGPDWSIRSFTEAPAPRQHWLALLENKPLPQPLLARVPAQAPYVLAGHFDPVGWINSLRPIAAAVHPDGQKNFDQALGLASMYVGRNLLTDILGPLGTDWVVYAPPLDKNADPTQASLLLINKVASEAKTRDGLISLTYALANTSQNPRVRAAGFSFTAGQKDVNGSLVTFLKSDRPLPNVGPVTIAWTLKDGFLYAGTSLETVAAATTFDGPSLSDAPRLADLRRRLDAPADAALEYTDAAVTVPQIYPALRMLGDMGLGALQAEGFKPLANPLPPAGALQPHLSPILRLAWTDNAGFHARSTSPFPGSALIAGSGSTTALGTGALSISILLPSLNRARETANRVKCASNMKQIAHAIIAYANENDGKYPPDLGTLVITQPITVEVFLCPNSDTKRVDPTGLPLEQLRDRVTQTADFVYVGKNLNNKTVTPDTLVLYETIDHHTDGINMLFADGHIEFVRKAEAERIIAAGKDVPQNQGAR